MAILVAGPSHCEPWAHSQLTTLVLPSQGLPRYRAVFALPQQNQSPISRDQRAWARDPWIAKDTKRPALQAPFCDVALINFPLAVARACNSSRSDPHAAPPLLGSRQFYSPGTVFCEHRTKPEFSCFCSLATIRSLSVRLGSARKHPVRLAMCDHVSVPLSLRVHSPECSEGEFSEVGLPLYGVLRSSRRPGPFGTSLPKSDSLSCDLAAPGPSRGSWCAPRNREPPVGLRWKVHPDAQRP